MPQFCYGDVEDKGAGKDPSGRNGNDRYCLLVPLAKSMVWQPRFVYSLTDANASEKWSFVS